MRRDLIMLPVALYVLLLGVYWFTAGPDVFWAMFFYANEKSLCAFGFYMLYRESRSRFTRGLALYCLSLCVFMLGYYIYCFAYGHETYLTVGTFLIYSFVILTLIRIRQ